MGAEGTFQGREGHGPAQAVGTAEVKVVGTSSALWRRGALLAPPCRARAGGTRPGVSLVPKGWLHGPPGIPGLCPALPLHHRAL